MIRTFAPIAAATAVIAALNAGLMRLGRHLWTTEPAGGN